jgi:hypothetical protein
MLVLCGRLHWGCLDYTVTIIPESGGPEVGDDDDSAGDDDDSAGDDDDSAH